MAADSKSHEYCSENLSDEAGKAKEQAEKDHSTAVESAGMLFAKYLVFDAPGIGTDGGTDGGAVVASVNWGEYNAALRISDPKAVHSVASRHSGIDSHDVEGAMRRRDSRRKARASARAKEQTSQNSPQRNAEGVIILG